MIKKIKNYISKDKPAFIFIAFLIFAYVYVYYVDKRSNIEKCADYNYAYDPKTPYAEMSRKHGGFTESSSKFLLHAYSKEPFKEKTNDYYLKWFEFCETEKKSTPITFDKKWKGSIWLPPMPDEK